MRKTKLLAGSVLALIGGLAMTGMANADTTVTHNPDAGIHYTLNAGFDTEQEFTAGTITISDGETTITMLDRNLGATTAGIGCEDPGGWEYCLSMLSSDYPVYGYYFQRGNNYGINPNGPSSTSLIQVDVTDPGFIYDPLNQLYYYNPTFIKGNLNWLNDNVVDLRGGSTGDDIYSVNDDSWKINQEQVKQRRGPCPENFHVPSVGELDKVLHMMDNDVNAMHNTLLIPFASYQHTSTYYSNHILGLGYDAYLLSSSPVSENEPKSYHLLLSLYPNAGIFSGGRAGALSIRCFYDSYEINNVQVTVYDGTGDDKIELWSGKVESGQTVELPDLNFNKPNSYFVFDKWYMDPELTEEFVLDTPITEDVDLYAGYTESQTWIDRNGNPFEWDDITICDPEDSSACITMMDRNLGATTARTGVTCVKESITCVKLGWLNLGYKDYNTCVNDYRRDHEYYSAYYGDPEEMCGGGYYEGFDSYEECEAEKTRLENEYNECKENNKGVYGYHYQWGNNIGFDLINNEFTTTYDWAKWNLSYENYGYNRNSLFIRGDRDEGECYNGCDYWENNQHYNGLRGGSGDSEENNRGYDIDNHIAINVEGRQGPCPEGYHVPSAGEWNTVLDYYISENGDKGLIYNDGSYDGGLIDSYCGSGIVSYCYKEMLLSFCVEEDEDGNCIDYIEDFGEEKVDCETEEYDRKEVICNGYGDFFNLLNSYFKIPYAGDFYQYYGSGFVYLGSKNVLWSSSPVLTYSSSKDGIGESGIHSSNRINGNSVRCFKNTPDTEIQEEGGNDNTGGNNGGGNSGHSGGGHSGGGSSAGGSVGGGGGTTPSVNEEKDACGNGSCEEENNSAQELIIDRTKFNSDYSDEMNEAYQYAFSRSITTMEDIEKADMEGNLTRIAMAKMLSQYAINVLGKKPTNKIVPKFSDITEELNAEYDDGVTLAYQLGIMGINMPNNRFRPNDEVTRAEFVTALSRMKYNTPDGEGTYYSTHMNLLNRLGVITNTDPTMKELRGYVMIMLMRAK